jgi:hypothetical protein
VAGDWLNPPLQFVHRSVIAPTGDEDVCSFRYEAFRGSKTNPACPTRDECDVSIQLAAHFPFGRHSLPLSTMSSPPIRSSFLFLPLPRHPLLDIRRAMQHRDTFVLAGIEKPNGFDVHEIDLLQIQCDRLSTADFGLNLIEMVRSKLSAQPKSNFA